MSVDVQNYSKISKQQLFNNIKGITRQIKAIIFAATGNILRNIVVYL